MNNQNVTDENFEKWNDEMGEKYNPGLCHGSSSLLIRFVEWLRVRAILKYLDAQDGEKILDVGCGVGSILKEVRKGELTGLDLSSRFLEEAKKELRGRARFVKGNAEDMAKLFPNAAFDKIFTSEVIEHVLHPDRVVAEMHKLVSPQGTVIISIPHESLIKAVKKVLMAFGLFKLLVPRHKATTETYEWHLHDFDLNMLKEIVKDKFSIEKVKAIPFFFVPLRYVIKLKPIK